MNCGLLITGPVKAYYHSGRLKTVCLVDNEGRLTGLTSHNVLGPDVGMAALAPGALHGVFMNSKASYADQLLCCIMGVIKIGIDGSKAQIIKTESEHPR